MAPTQATPAKRALPSKESALFKELLSLYEAHQHKKAQKTADQILKKFPEHGETLAMKGLVLFQTGKKEEGLELIRKGIRLDLTSHIVWHVLGLAKKSEKDYEEAAKSYMQALRYEKENINMLRDAANLHMQLRNFEALEEVRLSMLRLRPNLRQSWIGMALAYHLNGNLSEARNVLETYGTLLKNIPDYDVDHSEILLYRARIMELQEDYTAALDFLETNLGNRRIVDTFTGLQARARLFSKLGRVGEADTAWRDLIDLNPDCLQYYESLLLVYGIDIDHLDPEKAGRCCELLRELHSKYPSSSPISRMLLRATSGEEFRIHVTQHLTEGFARGVPSLFMDIKAVLGDGEKSRIIREVAEESQGDRVLTSRGDPTVFVWAAYFLVQYLSHIGDHEGALELLANLENHTPTLPEIYTLRAKILKRLGDTSGACSAMEEARQLDGQDRFLNWKAAKYLLRANKCDEAQEILGLFTKKDASSPGSDLEEMQSLLYLVEEGDAFYRLGQPGMALKRFKSVEKVFTDFEDDQFDFHGYALRKFTLNSYLDVLEWEERVREHEAYIQAAVNASEIYIQLYDNPGAIHPGETRQTKKKARRPAKDEEAKKGQDAATPPPPKDDDPHGHKLLAVPDLLEQAAKLLSPVLHTSQRCLNVWAMAFEVDIRRKKYLLACKALIHSHRINPNDAELHLRLVHFAHALTLPGSKPEEDVREVINSELESILPANMNLSVYNQQFLQRSPLNGESIWATARANALLGATEDEFLEAANRVTDPGVTLSLKTAMDIVRSLEKGYASNTRTPGLLRQIALRFPRANAFSHVHSKIHANGHVEEPRGSFEVLF